VLVENIKSLQNKLKDSKELSHRLSSDNLKNLFCVQKHVSNKPSMIVDSLVAYTSHASNSNFRKTMFVKPMKVEEAKANIVCLDKGKNSCVNNCVNLNSRLIYRNKIKQSFFLDATIVGLLVTLDQVVVS
jgi:hypothetical protein